MYLNPYPLLEQALLSDNPDEKGRLTQALFAQLGEAEGLTVDESKPVDCRFAGHPLRPRLVAPSEVTPRKMNTVEGYAAMLHAIAHIEFNAINLALEARGLDVTPGIRAKVAQRGDVETCDVLDIIYRDEVGHVAIGNHWYQHLCRERGLEPVALFRSLIAHYDMFIFRGYVNIEARERAGFSRFELDMLEDFEKSLKQDKKAV